MTEIFNNGGSQVTLLHRWKKTRNQWQIFNRKSISRYTTHRQYYHLIQI